MLIDIPLILFLLLLNGLFAMSEIALVSSRRARLVQLAESGRTGAARAPGKAEKAPPPVSATTDDVKAEKARLTREQADRAARINRREEGELLPAEMVEKEWTDILAGIRSALLAVPARVAQAHPGHSAIIATLDHELRAVLADLADDTL